MDIKIENLGGGISVCTTKEHGFCTDSLLLSHFAAPKPGVLACDLGSGCGIIPLLWMRGGEKAPEKIYAVDVQPAAIELVARSAALNGLEERLVPVLADLRELPGELKAGSFDLITVNPPYKAANTGVMSGGESDKIARHETLCTIGDCCAAAERLLRFGGRLCLCQLPERLVDVLSAMRSHRLEPKRLRFVQKDASSAPWLVLVEAKRGAKPFLKAEAALVIYENGATSAEMREIYKDFGQITENKS